MTRGIKHPANHNYRRLITHCVHFAARATADTLFSVGLIDPICLPSTMYAAYHRYTAPKDMRLWRYADHVDGYGATARVHLTWLRKLGVAPRQT